MKMKKSELRKIVREAVKEVLTEQTPVTCDRVDFMAACPNQGSMSYRGWYTNNQNLSSGPNNCPQINGNPITNADAGTLIVWPEPYQSGPFGGGPCDVYELIGTSYPVTAPPLALTISSCNAINNYSGPMSSPVVPQGAPCTQLQWGCMDPTANNYDPYVTMDCSISYSLCINNQPPGPTCCCDYTGMGQLEGCMDPSAINFDPNAQLPCDGMSPTSPPCMPNVPPGPDCCCDYGGGTGYGCMNPAANNFDPNATMPCDGQSGMPQAPPCINNQTGPDCCCDISTQQIDGCMDQNAFNYDPNATNQPNLANICDYGWRCKEGWKPGIGNVCGPGDVNNPGDFATKQDCIESGCEPRRADIEKYLDRDAGDTAPDMPAGQDPDVGPLQEASLMERFQKLANISKKK